MERQKEVRKENCFEIILTSRLQYHENRDGNSYIECDWVKKMKRKKFYVENTCHFSNYFTPIMLDPDLFGLFGLQILRTSFA